MLKSLVTSLLIAFFVLDSYAQNQLEIICASRIDTSDSEMRMVFDAYSEYFYDKPERVYDVKNWNTDEMEKHMLFDFSYQHLFSNVLKGREDKFKLYVMSIEPIYGTEKYQIKALLQWGEGLKTNRSISLIHKITVKFENEDLVFENNFVEMTKNWKREKIGRITYCYHPDYRFDTLLASKANHFIDSVYNLLQLDLPKTEINYTLARDFDEFANLLGFDYYSFQFTSGITSTWDSDIKTMKGPFHAHELVHLITKYKSDFILTEGLADYFGTKLTDNKGYLSHQKKLIDHIGESKSSLKDYFEGSIPWMGFNHKYTLGALLCEYINNEYGLSKLIELLKIDTQKEYTLLGGIEKVTNLKEEEFFIEFGSFLCNLEFESL